MRYTTGIALLVLISTSNATYGFVSATIPNDATIDFSAQDAWRIGNGTTYFSDPVPYPGAQVMAELSLRNFPDDWYSQGEISQLRHWWILTSPTYGEFAKLESSTWVVVDHVKGLRAELDKFSTYVSGVDTINVYYSSRSVQVPEPAAIGYAAVVLLLCSILRRRSR